MSNFDYNQSVTITEMTKLIRLSYLQTIAVLDDSALLSRISGETPGAQASSFASDPGSPGFLGIGAEGPTSTSSVFSDSGWSISRSWVETWWDKIRWAIGIRDIGIFSYEYALTSEFVSVPFRSPKAIEKISLRVDENIPSTYPAVQRWIHYFVSPNDGTDWHRINPLDHPTLFADGGGRPTPRILNFNVDFASEDDDDKKFVSTNEEVVTVRFRAVFLRPPDAEFSGTSPILKSYRMLIYPRDGLLS